MRIAFFHELHFGGARRVVFEYAKVLSKNNQIDLFYVDSVKEKDLEQLFSNFYFYKIPFKKYVGHDPVLKFYKDFIEPVRLYFLHKKIAKKIDSLNYDFVFIHPSQFTHAPFILRFIKTPNIYYCQEPLRTVYDDVVSIDKNINFLKRMYEEIGRNFKKRIDFFNIKSAKVVLSNSEYSKKNIKNAYGIDSEICYLGVDPEIFKLSNKKKKYDLIFVGEDVWMEGYDTFLEINKLFDNKLKTFIVKSEKGEHISDIRLSELYQQSKIVVVLGRLDPFSMIPWEGMASGAVPVIVNEGGVVDAIENKKNGFIVERNAIKLKKIIETLLDDEKLRNKISIQGRKDIENKWNWDKSTKRLLEIYKKYYEK